MRKLLMTAAVGATLTGTAMAQSLNDAGRLLQQVLPGQQQPSQSQADRDRAIYEQGRRDSEQSGRRQGDNEGRYDSRPDDRRRADDRQRSDRDQDRRRGDQDRRYDDDNRAPRQPGRYQPLDNR